MVLWSAVVKSAALIELAVLWEKGLEAVHKRKKAKYADLTREIVWSLTLYLVEVGARGFMDRSTPRPLKDQDLCSVTLSRFAKELLEEGQKVSHWLWLNC